MQLVLDTPYEYRGYHGCQSRCRLRVYRQPGRKPVVVVTDLGVGTSVTNKAEQLATEVAAMLRLGACSRLAGGSDRTGPPAWFEHYPLKPGWPPDDPAMGEHFGRVTFRWDAHGVASEPRWDEATAWEIEALVGHPVAEARP